MDRLGAIKHRIKAAAASRANGYTRADFLSDLKAGFITSIVALPLAIAFAIASGVAPAMGLYTAIIAGVLASAVGGSRHSITGPTGAMTVIILSTVHKFGLEGLLLAGLLAGVFQIMFGAARLGRFVKYIPLPVVSGFTAGIGLLIFSGQIANFLGITVPAKEHVWETFAAIAESIGGTHLAAVCIGLATLLMLTYLPQQLSKNKLLRYIPPSLIPLVGFTAAMYLLHPPIPRVGDIPYGLPTFSLPHFDFQLLKDVLPAGLTIALLGAIEALLCAVVADGMTGTKHDSDKELIGQGIANVVLPFFGGMPSTAAIARTAVNVREGAKTRMAGIIHALFLLSFMLVFAPIVTYVPKAFLAGILIFVSLRMINLHELRTILRLNRLDAIVAFTTMGLTVATDLVFAVQVGMFLAILLLFVQFTKVTEISAMEQYDPSTPYNAAVNQDPALKDKVAIYTIYGPFFFGAVNIFEHKVNEHMHVSRPIIILRMKGVQFIDSTGATRLKEFIADRRRKGRHVLLSTLLPRVKKTLMADEEFAALQPAEHVFERTAQAIEYARKKLAPNV